MVTEVAKNEIYFLKSIEESIPINFDGQKVELGKSFEGIPVFTVKEIENHKKEKGKKWCGSWKDKWQKPLI